MSWGPASALSITVSDGSTILSITPGCTSAAICAIMLAVSPSMIHVLCSRTGKQKEIALLGPGGSVWGPSRERAGTLVPFALPFGAPALVSEAVGDVILAL